MGFTLVTERGPDHIFERNDSEKPTEGRMNATRDAKRWTVCTFLKKTNFPNE